MRRPRFDLKADGENVPHHDAEADGQIDAAGHHRQGRGRARERATIDLSARIERALKPGGERVGEQDREQDDQGERPEGEARRPKPNAKSFAQAKAPASSGRVGSGSVRFNGLHARLPPGTPAEAAKGRRGAPYVSRGGREADSPPSRSGPRRARRRALPQSKISAR